MRMLLVVLASGMTLAGAQSSPPAQKPSPAIQQDSQQGSLANSLSKGTKKITGCIRSENAKFVLDNKQHKKIWLTGSPDFASHAGHSVVLYGNFLKTSTSAKTDSDFQVTRVEMISDTCSLDSATSK